MVVARGLLSAWLLVAWAMLARGEGLSEYASAEVKREFSRVFRPNQDLIPAESRPGKPSFYQAQTLSPRIQVQQKQSPRPTPHVKAIDHEINRQSVSKTRNPINKFKPSPEDPYLQSSYAVPSQKYIQKYAEQLYTVQKNAGQLSEYQKYILNQDPLVKNFVFAPQPTSRTPKYLAEVSTAEPTTRRPPTTTFAPARSTTAIDSVTLESKTAKKLKALDVGDSTAQPTAVKYVFEPEIVAHYIPTLVATEQKEPLSAFHQYSPQYGLVTGGLDELTKLNAYKAAQTVSVHYGGSEDKPEHGHYEDPYPTKEPKYEFTYEVKDHEKNSNFGHAEARKGKTTWGKYYVQLSDGRFETVKYWADKTGYHAQVDFQGEAKHPPPKPKEVNIAAGYAPLHDIRLYAAQQDAILPQYYSVSESPSHEYL